MKYFRAEYRQKNFQNSPEEVDEAESILYKKVGEEIKKGGELFTPNISLGYDSNHVPIGYFEVNGIVMKIEEFKRVLELLEEAKEDAPQETQKKIDTILDSWSKENVLGSSGVGNG